MNTQITLWAWRAFLLLLEDYTLQQALLFNLRQGYNDLADQVEHLSNENVRLELELDKYRDGVPV